MVRGGQDNRKFRNIRRKKKVRKSFPVPRQGQSNVDFDEPTTSHEIIDEDIITEGEEVIIVPLEDEDTSNLEAEKVIEPSVNKTVTQEKVCQIEEENYCQLLNGYRFFDLSLLSIVFEHLGCPKCQSVGLRLEETLKQGMAFKFELHCKSNECLWYHTFFNSKRNNKKLSVQSKMFDINPRAVYSMRRCGNGYANLTRFLMLMNHPPPMSEKSYRKLNNKVNNSVKIVASNSMNAAAEDIKAREATSADEHLHNYIDTGVSVDGTWQRRGFSSLNGAVAAISMVNGKILDLDTLTRYCQGCVTINAYKVSHPERYELLKADHIETCSINHKGSAPAMEVAGATTIFGRSMEKHNLRYTHFYGDGDSKSYEKVKNLYTDLVVEKFECVGHIQKRVGNRLRKKKKEVKGLGGKKRLTDEIIDRLQNYFGIAIRTNIGDLSGMKSAIAAVLFHVASTKEKPWHVHCPDGEASWCGFKRDIANGTTLYKHGAGLPMDVIKHVKPVFEELSDDKLLRKCLHGKTQNQNESYNSTIWHRIPKSIFVSATTFQLGVYDAAAHFNVGNIASLQVYDEIGIERGCYTILGCSENNNERINNSLRKSSELYKSRRRQLRGLCKRKGDKDQSQEGVTYCAGKFTNDESSKKKK